MRITIIAAFAATTWLCQSFIPPLPSPGVSANPARTTSRHGPICRESTGRLRATTQTGSEVITATV
jgi:hypothetical protein